MKGHTKKMAKTIPAIDGFAWRFSDTTPWDGLFLDSSSIGQPFYSVSASSFDRPGCQSPFSEARAFYHLKTQVFSRRFWT
jgi:hypothetical protein